MPTSYPSQPCGNHRGEVTAMATVPSLLPLHATDIYKTGGSCAIYQTGLSLDTAALIVRQLVASVCALILDKPF